MTPDLTPAACGRPVEGRFGGKWPCERAVDHDGDCKPPIDSRYYAQPLDEFDAAWLASEVRLLHTQIEHMERTRREDRTAQRHANLLSRLIGLAPANGGRKTVAAEDVRRAWQEAING